MSIADFFFGRKQNSTNKLNRKSVRTRNLRLEALEERALLSVTPLSADEYSALSAQYAEFNLPENMGDLNVITLDLAEGDGLTELKNAIQTAGTTTQSDLIVVRTSDSANTITYSSSSDELKINSKITIVGYGSKPLTLDANQQCCVISVSGSNVNLGALTITNGKSVIGGIYNYYATLTVANSTILGNTAFTDDDFNSSYGGGIYNSGTLTLTNSTISGNTATSSYESSYGGGIYNSGTLTLTNSTISGNTASGSEESYGGGIYNNKGTLTITNSTISGNTASGDDGGGIYNEYGTLTVTNSTISGNTARYHGGGIYNSGTITVANCTISGNTADSGGGICNSGSNAILTVTNSTISGNTVSGSNLSYGGGISNYGLLTVINSTISGNTAYTGGGIYNSNGTLTATNSIISRNYSGSLFGSLSSDSSNNLIGGYYPGFVCDPIFDSDGKLANADTMDLHLRSDSIAIDQGNNAFAEDFEFDFDGNVRIYGEAVDIGAYEYQGDRNDEPIPYSTVVNTLNDSFDLDDDEWSLREAIYYAPEYVTITFADELEGTILLTLGELNIEAPLAIDGDNRITIDGAQKSRVFFVSGGTEEAPVVLNGLTIQNGYTFGYGGGIYNCSTLTVTNCTILRNTVSAGTGSGIYNAGSYGTLTITNCTISGNTASSSSGGGISNYGLLTVTNSTISGNTAGSSSGGIYNYYGTLTVANSTISGNTAGYSGGGIFNSYGTLTIANSMISGNTARSSGGGIINAGSNGTLTIANSMISGNTAKYGGGISNSYGTLTVANSTISGNTASYNGGGISNYGLLTVANSTIAGNTASNGGGIYNSISSSGTQTATINNSIVIDTIYKESGTISGSYNLSTFTDWSSGSGNISYNSSKPLFVNAANGDYHLIAGSQAIDKGSNALAVDASGQALAYDLDNLTRIANGKVDIGAYEYHTPLTAPTLSAATTGSYSIMVTVGEVENASGYTLEYSTSSDFADAASQNVSAGETTIAGLNANRTYYFRVMALGEGDYRDSEFSASASATTDRITLTTPTLTSSVRKTTATFSWDEDPNASGYQFEYKAAGAEDWTVENVEGTSFSFDGDQDVTYTARVMALGVDDYTDSAYSEEQVVYINGAQVAINGKKVTVDWIDDSPAADSIRYRVAGTTKWTVKKLKAGVTTFTFNGTIGKDYEIEVLLDQQEAKVYKATAVILDQPKLKADKTFLKDDTFQVSVTNYAAKNLADNAIQAIVTVNGVQTTFDIENQEGSAELTNGGSVAFANGLFTFTEMNSNTSYKVQVAFSDGLNVSTASSNLTVKTTKAPYLAPAIVSATAVSDTSIVVDWETAKGKGSDVEAQKYTVQYSLDGVKWTNATTGATGNSYTIQKLKGGNVYHVRVLATKDSAFLASDPSEILTAETLALPKHTLDKTTLTDDSFTVNVSNYRTTNLPTATVVNVKSDKFGETAINLENGAGSAAFADGVTVAFENGDLTFANVPSNTQQKIQVNFSDGVCTTAWSSALTVKTAMAKYNKPVLSSPTVLSSTSVLVEWTPVTGKSSPIEAQKYTVQYSLDGNKWTNATTGATGTSFTITKLKPSTKYLVAVIANKDANFLASDPSDSQEVTTL